LVAEGFVTYGLRIKKILLNNAIKSISNGLTLTGKPNMKNFGGGLNNKRDCDSTLRYPPVQNMAKNDKMAHPTKQPSWLTYKAN